MADKLLAKVLQIFETFQSVNNDLRGKSVSSLPLPVIFDYRFIVISIALFVADFNLLICKLDNFILNL